MLAVTDGHGDRQRWCAKRTSDDSEPGGGQIDEMHLDGGAAEIVPEQQPHLRRYRDLAETFV